MLVARRRHGLPRPAPAAATGRGRARRRVWRSAASRQREHAHDRRRGGRRPAGPPGLQRRIRRHPYVRLALNGSFSALWIGQVISLFGDRVNQIALAAFVYEVTESPLALALTFLVGTIPNLLFSPDRRRVRGSLGPQAGARRLRHPARRPGAPRAGGGPGQRLACLPARVPDHDGLDLLPPGPDGHPAAARRRGGPAVGELRHVGGRDDRGRHQLPDRGPVRGVPRRVAPDRVLVRCRDVPRVRDAAGDDHRATAGPRATGAGASRAEAAEAEARSRRQAEAEPRATVGAGPARRLGVPAPRGRPARQHDPGHGRPVGGRHRHRRVVVLAQQITPAHGRRSTGEPTRSWRPRSVSATWWAGSCWA